MTVSTRVATESDRAFLVEADSHISGDVLDALVSAGRVMVVEDDGVVVGLLRWGMFWDQVPFMNLLWVLPDRRGRGIGSVLVRAWEDTQVAAGHDMVLTSTMSDERSQRLYRRLGYVDCGALFLPDEPAELILRKPLTSRQLTRHDHREVEPPESRPGTAAASSRSIQRPITSTT